MGKSIVNIDTVRYIGTKGDMLEVIVDNELIDVRVGDLVYYNKEMAFYDGTRFVHMNKEDEKLVDKNGDEIKVGDYVSIRETVGVEYAHPFYGRVKSINYFIKPLEVAKYYGYKWLAIETVNCEDATFNPQSKEINVDDCEIEKVTYDDIKKLCVAELQHFIDVTKDNIKAQRRQLKFYKQKMLNLKRLKTFPRKD
jgi:hypothetical protein